MSDRPSHPAHPALTAFWDGLTGIRLSTALGIFAFALAELALLAALVTPDRVAALPAGVVARHGGDDGASTTVAALQMARTAGARPTVVLVGASSLREALLDAESLRTDLAGRLGVAEDRLEVHDLTTSGQELFESLALLDLLPAETPGVLVIGAGAARLMRPRATTLDRFEHPDLAIDAPALDARGAELGFTPPHRSGVYLLDHLQFYVTRPQLLWRPFTGPIALARHRYLGRTPWTEKRWVKGLDTLVALLDDPTPVTEANLGALSAALPRLAAGGRRSVVLLDAVMHPRARERVGPLVAGVEARVREMAGRHGAQYLSLDAEARIEPGDFYDHTHFVTETAMQRYQSALAGHLAPLLRPCVTTPGAGCRP